MKGDATGAMSEFRGQYDLGADPLIVLQDLTAMVHEMTRLKLSAEAAIHGWAEQEVARARAMANKLGVPQLTRAWQILLKALGEVQLAPDTAAAVDMALVRLCFAAELPPADRLAKLVLDHQGAQSSAGPRPQAPPPSGPRAQLTAVQGAPRPAPQLQPQPPVQAPDPARTVSALPTSFRAVAALAGEMRAAKLKFQIEHQMRLVAFERGRIEVNLRENADGNAAGELAERLTAWTGERWIVSISNDEGEPTLADQAAEREAARRADAAADPLLKAALDVFPGAKIVAIRDIVVDAAPSTESETDA
jgi:DNA polymerase-3 subunit gamma/tau